MSYATYSEFIGRYDNDGVQSEVNCTIFFASARVDRELASVYIVPFSSNNITAKDLTIDQTELIILQRSKTPQDDWIELKKCLDATYEALRSGQESMVTTSGSIQGEAPGNLPMSTNQGFKPTFDMRDSEQQRIDPDRLEAERAEDI